MNALAWNLFTKDRSFFTS